MTEITLDDRGRFTLPKRIREEYGDRFQVVRLDGGLKLIPVAEDPLEALRDEFADVDKSAEELRDGAREHALDDAGSQI